MRKKLIFSFCFLFAFIVSASVSSLAAHAGEEALPVSHGIYVLAQDSGMAMAGIKGNKISFEAEDFARAMNLSEVRSITVTEAPPVADGELLVGSTVLGKGQTVSASNISLMSYSAKAETSSVSYFKFRVDSSPYEIRCNLYLLDGVNRAPTLNVAAETALDVSTHKDVTLYGTLPAYDPDGDEIIIEVVSYPEEGLLILTDRASGSYTYTPMGGYTGKDSFTYVARDKYGNYSASKTVTLTVTKPLTSTVYADMEDSPDYNAALTVTEQGIMSGTQIGANTYFYPEATVSRAEFLVMAMNSAGIKEVAEVSETVFSDDADIAKDMKGYIAAAYRLGYIKGSYEDGKLCFLPNEPISRAEAAVIVCNMTEVATPTVSPAFDDHGDIPAFAEAAVCSLGHMGILTAQDGNIMAEEHLSRAQGARMLSYLIDSAEK